MTRLSNGKPIIAPMEYDLGGKKLVDVKGWAPTEDGFGFESNNCYNE